MRLNKPVDFSTAKLLKEKGFEERTEFAYKTDSTLISFKGQGGINANLNYLVGIKYNKFRQNTKNALTSAPTIAQVIMWLYEKHGIFIYAKPTSHGDVAVFIEDIYGKSLYDKENSDLYQKAFMCTFEINESYEVAIEYCLTKLI